MAKNIKSQIKMNRKARRLAQLPETLRQELIATRKQRGWTQTALGEKIGLPQMHISGIETGKIVPRYDTLLDVVRVLGLDLVTVPRALVPAILALIRDYSRRNESDVPTEAERAAERRYINDL